MNQQQHQQQHPTSSFSVFKEMKSIEEEEEPETNIIIPKARLATIDNNFDMHISYNTTFPIPIPIPIDNNPNTKPSQKVKFLTQIHEQQDIEKKPKVQFKTTIPNPTTIQAKPITNLIDDNIPCDICNCIGISSSEYDQLSSQKKDEAMTNGYLLYSCFICKAVTHLNCLKSITANFQMNINDNFINWICPFCYGNSQISTSTCVLCDKDGNQLKRRHFMIEGNEEEDGSEVMHLSCFYWAKMYDYAGGKDEDEDGNGECCYVCNVRNSSREFVMKCSCEGCEMCFHMSCIREREHYEDVQIVDKNIYAVCYCEKHSFGKS